MMIPTNALIEVLRRLPEPRYIGQKLALDRVRFEPLDIDEPGRAETMEQAQFVTVEAQFVIRSNSHSGLEWTIEIPTG